MRQYEYMHILFKVLRIEDWSLLEAGLLGACCDPNKEEMYFYPENVFNYWNFRVLPLLR